jgi:hypothetical protein
VPVHTAGDNLAVVADAGSGSKEGNRWLDEKIKILRCDAAVENERVAAAILDYLRPDDFPIIVETLGKEGQFPEAQSLFDVAGAPCRVPSSSDNLTVVVDGCVQERLSARSTQIVHLSLGVEKKVIRAGAGHRADTDDLVQVVDTRTRAVCAAESANINQSAAGVDKCMRVPLKLQRIFGNVHVPVDSDPVTFPASLIPNASLCLPNTLSMAVVVFVL